MGHYVLYLGGEVFSFVHLVVFLVGVAVGTWITAAVMLFVRRDH